jgi:protoheme IX farnesyltransferase
VSRDSMTVLAIPAMPNHVSRASVLADYWTLTKPDVNLLILITAAAGFCLALPAHLAAFPALLLVHTLAGTLLVASGTATLNQYVERRFDAQMRRTKRRPLAAGRIKPSRALWFGIALSASGVTYLAAVVNLSAGILAVLTLLLYLLIYTPLKRKTPLCVLVGAIPGATPPLIGWAAASGTLSLEAWVLYAIVFLWQFPHFMAIAWMYREDYQRAGYLVLPHDKRRNSLMALQALLPSLGLMALSFAPMLLGKAGLFYAAGALLFSMCFVYYSAQLAIHKTNAGACRLLLASILYLPAVFGLMMLNRM